MLEDDDNAEEAAGNRFKESRCLRSRTCFAFSTSYIHRCRQMNYNKSSAQVADQDESVVHMGDVMLTHSFAQKSSLQLRQFSRGLGEERIRCILVPCVLSDHSIGS